MCIIGVQLGKEQRSVHKTILLVRGLCLCITTIIQVYLSMETINCNLRTSQSDLLFPMPAGPVEAIIKVNPHLFSMDIYILSCTIHFSSLR